MDLYWVRVIFGCCIVAFVSGYFSRKYERKRMVNWIASFGVLVNADNFTYSRVDRSRIRTISAAENLTKAEARRIADQIQAVDAATNVIMESEDYEEIYAGLLEQCSSGRKDNGSKDIAD